MSQEIKKLMQDAYRYFYDDGLVELAIGGLFFIIAAAMLVMKLFVLGTPYAWLMGVILPVLVLGLTFGTKSLLETLKERLTYRRTGYVRYRDQPSRGRWVVIIGAIALGVIAIVFQPKWSQYMSIYEGGLLALILVYMGYRVGLVRLYVLATIVALAGIGAAQAGLDDLLGSVVTFGIAGLVLMVSGGLTLAAYLRKNPPSDEQEA